MGCLRWNTVFWHLHVDDWRLNNLNGRKPPVRFNLFTRFRVGCGFTAQHDSPAGADQGLSLLGIWTLSLCRWWNCPNGSMSLFVLIPTWILVLVTRKSPAHTTFMSAKVDPGNPDPDGVCPVFLRPSLGFVRKVFCPYRSFHQGWSYWESRKPPLHKVLIDGEESVYCIMLCIPSIYGTGIGIEVCGWQGCWNFQHYTSNSAAVFSCHERLYLSRRHLELSLTFPLFLWPGLFIIVTSTNCRNAWSMKARHTHQMKSNSFSLSSPCREASSWAGSCTSAQTSTCSHAYEM